MSQNTVNMTGLHIGIEAELLLQTITFEEDRDIPNLKIFAYMIAASYNDNAPNWAAKMHEEVDIDGIDDIEDASRYTEWVLTNDETIEPEPHDPEINPRQWPLEVVSPVLEFTEASDFRHQVENVWEHLKANTMINANESCGTHIHVSPQNNNGIWALSAVKAICRSILFFEFAFEVLLPPHRRQNIWAKSNLYDNDHFPEKTVEACFSLIDGCQDIPRIVQLMNDGDDKYFGWNFLNLLEDGKTTIEFRRPPGVKNAKECLAWVEFTVTFVQAAVQSGNALTNNMGVAANVQTLKNFLGHITVSGGEPARLEAIFRGKSGAIFPQKVNMIGYSPEEMNKIEMMKAKGKNKNLMRKKMEQSTAQTDGVQIESFGD